MIIEHQVSNKMRVLKSHAVFIAGQNLKPEDVAELQRMAENVGLIADRRAAFVALFLDPEDSPL